MAPFGEVAAEWAWNEIASQSWRGERYEYTTSSSTRCKPLGSELNSTFVKSRSEVAI